MSEISPELRAALEKEYGPVLAEFTLDRSPQGGAPEHIKEQWVGVPLPVRERHLAQGAFSAIRYLDFITSTHKVNKVPISVVGIEAVDSLVVAGKQEAADYWRRYELGIFVFRGYEGQLKALD